MTAIARFGTELTERQLKCLQLAAQGFSNAQIGRQMYVSMETAKSQLATASMKLGARNRAHLVALAIRQGLIS